MRSVWLCSFLLLAAEDASAYWLRMGGVGGEARTGSQLARAGELGLYESRYGLGLGTTVLEGQFGAWDLPRRGRPDASGHLIVNAFPLQAFATLYSWRGPAFLHFMDDSKADYSIGRLEAYGSYSNWARMHFFSDVQTPTFFGPPERTVVPRVTAQLKVIDYGLRADHMFGLSWTLAVGRQEITARESDVFRRKYFSRWYGSVGVYIGATTGTDYSGGVYRIFTDSWRGLKALFGGSTVRKEKL